MCGSWAGECFAGMKLGCQLPIGHREELRDLRAGLFCAQRCGKRLDTLIVGSSLDRLVTRLQRKIASTNPLSKRFKFPCDRTWREVPKKELRLMPPILRNKHYEADSAFTPESILREARRRKGFERSLRTCRLRPRPHGDMVRYLKRAGRAHRDAVWACYHTELYRTNEADLELGIVPCALALRLPFSSLFASGCKLLISVHLQASSSNRVTRLISSQRPRGDPQRVVEALRRQGSAEVARMKYLLARNRTRFLRCSRVLGWQNWFSQISRRFLGQVQIGGAKTT
jgi:hypothetical protein